MKITDFQSFSILLHALQSLKTTFQSKVIHKKGRYFDSSETIFLFLLLDSLNNISKLSENLKSYEENKILILKKQLLDLKSLLCSSAYREERKIQETHSLNILLVSEYTTTLKTNINLILEFIK